MQWSLQAYIPELILSYETATWNMNFFITYKISLGYTYMA